MVLTRLSTVRARLSGARRGPGLRHQFRWPHQRHSLPSLEGQRELLSRIYGHGGIDPNRLAFVEAHGTGTRVGDPAEADRHRPGAGPAAATAPLPIGSVKSNIGHLEPASGLAGC
jgi:phthiocerol/phenolphthiocerol synthesis type-I polyketide synthase C